MTYDFLSKLVLWRRNECTTLLTLTSASSTPSSASSAEALAPVSGKREGGLALRSADCGPPLVLDLRRGGGAGARTDLDGALDDHGAVDLVDDAINLLQIVRVRDDLVVGDDIL